MTKIVVGIDGSAGARRALRWAADEAELRGGGLTVVHTWQLPYVLATPCGTVPIGANQPEANVQADVHAMIDAAEQAAPAIVIERVVTAGSPAAELIAAAADADLLVVGSRGHGGFAGLL